jgi:hypothetical protein
MDAVEIVRMIREAGLRLAFVAATSPEDSPLAQTWRLLVEAPSAPGRERTTG